MKTEHLEIAKKQQHWFHCYIANNQAMMFYFWSDWLRSQTADA